MNINRVHSYLNYYSILSPTSIHINLIKYCSFAEIICKFLEHKKPNVLLKYQNKIYKNSVNCYANSCYFLQFILENNELFATYALKIYEKLISFSKLANILFVLT